MPDWYTDTFGTKLSQIETYLYTFCNRYPKRAELLWEIINYHFGWNESKPKPSGKRIRPLMTLLVAEAITGEYQHTLPAAGAVELIHNFTLIHDDIMDISTERRGRPSVWYKWNQSQAINSGDGLYTVGLSATFDLSQYGCEPERINTTLQALLDACLATVEGQMLDVGFETRLDITPDDYLGMIYLKTGTLIEASAKIGALLSTDDETSIQAYGRFAHDLGIAFQIQDDYLGIWGQAEQTGKSATSDIESKKKSYPILLALAESSPASQSTLKQRYAQDHLSLDDVAHVKDILQTVNAAERTQQLMNQFYDQALQALQLVQVGQKQHQKLTELAQFLIQRAY